MDRVVWHSTGTPRLYLLLLGGLAGCALLLAVVGVYGVMSYAVSRRSRELAIRLALGAGPARLVGEVAGETLRPVLAGLGLGVVGALALTRLMGGLLYGVTAWDRTAFLGSVVVLLGAALAATLLPARRATRTDPLRALRED